MAKQPTDYKQTDSKWSKTPYAVKGESSTIGSAGCGPTSCADLLSAYVDKTITPPAAAKWMLAKGYKALNQGTFYSGIIAYIKSQGLSITQLNGANLYHAEEGTQKTWREKVKKILKAGDVLIVVFGVGDWTTSGHFCVAYDIDDNDNVYINDPASSKAERAKAPLSKVVNQVKYYWEVKVPDKYRAAPKPAAPAKPKTYKFKVTTEFDPKINIWKDKARKIKTGKTLKKGAVIELTTSKPSGSVAYGGGYVNSKYLKLVK
jgi:predicted double-glycine peptidase